MEPAAIRRAAPSLSAAAEAPPTPASPWLHVHLLPLLRWRREPLPRGRGRGGAGAGVVADGDSGAGAAAAAAVAALGETETADADVILLHVGGMSCGGCAANVKRILESQSKTALCCGKLSCENQLNSVEISCFQPEITSATVDFEGKTAAVWTTPEAKATKDWQKQLGEKLAHHLSTCGFQSHLLDEGEAKQS
ncbi:hypothetical protein GUJ93_ZPchr0013g37481 [Zizania palustris]|uniref:HMA domain-containing protein n=1 Tax=Zizania palustris TaxID=103762 RepID=A0A8J5WYC8_ZIZPA|nr:hypothetical protein GUJ93_ZPchr0013g37481 [Zizania palustris]